jgi:hypothetical protein
MSSLACSRISCGNKTCEYFLTNGVTSSASVAATGDLGELSRRTQQSGRSIKHLHLNDCRRKGSGAPPLLAALRNYDAIGFGSSLPGMAAALLDSLEAIQGGLLFSEAAD